MKKRLFIFDGHSLCYQAFHAIQMLNAPDGSPVNAVYGFINTILKVVRSEKPDYVAVVFDAPEATFRHKAFADYKAQRKPMPDDLRPQIEGAKAIAAAAGIPCHEKGGFEADDLLAALAEQATARGLAVCLVTLDKDAKQLLGPEVRIYNSRKECYYTADDLLRETGLTPAQMVDFFCLVGDASDNVPGVEGVGPKTAQKLLLEHVSLEGIYERLDGIPKPALREKLAAARERVFANRGLIRLKNDAPVELRLDGGDFLKSPPEPLKAHLEKLGFRRLLASLTGAAPVPAAPPAGRASAPAASPTPRASIAYVAIDVQEGSPAVIGISTGPGDAQAAPLPDGLRPLRDSLERDGRLVGWDLKRSWRFLTGLPPAALDRGFDLLLSAYLLDPDHPPRSLDQLLESELGETLPCGAPDQDQPLLSLADTGAREELAAKRAGAAGRLAAPLAARLAAEGLDAVFSELEMPLVRVLADMETTGVRIDVEGLAALGRSVEKDLARLEGEAHAAAGQPFNVASPSQLSDILFGKLGLPRVKKIKTGSSTDSDVLETLAERHPLPGIILAHRQIAKLKSTYIDALPRKVSPTTGRLHTTFHQAAATGRLSSSDPNLQNIPIRSELGRKIRAAFLASEGQALLSADYSQIEFRILAHFSRDPGLTRAFKTGRDVHVQVAALLYGVPEAGVTDAQRRVAKGVAYSLIYGKTPFTLARDLKIPVGEAQTLMEAFFREFAGVKAFQEEVLAGARKDLSVRTLLGRLRRMPNINAANRYLREAAERTAVNAVIQGTAADLMKRAMIDAHRGLAREAPGARLLLQIHDELLIDAPKGELDAVRAAVVEAMEKAADLSVPLVANVGVGANWLEAHE